MVEQQPGDITYRYIVGIDLGTTNSALAFVDLEAQQAPGKARIRLLEIPQLVAAGQLGKRRVLPSFLYLPGQYDLPQGAAALPWAPDRDFLVGEFARDQGALVPGRLVSSAKSWLCHAGVDRVAPILPWGAHGDVPTLSPVAASARYLQHLREAWNQTMARGRDECNLEEQLIVLTVPASFDEVARELTVAAAAQAGLNQVVLLEEPLAAFYSWLSANESGWREKLAADRIILVCDVGGGTTDFTLVATREGAHGLRFDRLAVGDHLMLGGDNMDLTLARHLEIQMLGQPGRLEPKRWHQLTHQCRRAKEILLGSGDGQERIEVTVMGGGGRLIADTLKGGLTRGEVNQWILEGFFPEVSLDADPSEKVRTGISEWGLPYVRDPAVTRHLAGFWRRHLPLLEQEIEGRGAASLYPDYVLFNGGALTPATVRARLREVVAHWFRESAGAAWNPEELVNPNPELAVAMGAAYYGLVRLGEGVRVGAGSPRSYYVRVAEDGGGVEAEAGFPAVCLVPRGTEEGFQAELAEPAFQVLTNQPVAFQMYSSSTRLGDRLGEVVRLGTDQISQLPAIRTALRYGRKGLAQTLPVLLAVRLNEIGTLELWCRSRRSPHQWQLQFDVRHGAEPNPAPASGETLDQDQIEAARGEIRKAFGPGDAGVRSSLPTLVKALIAALDLGRDKWPTALIRQLADTLIELAGARAFSAQHEARWLNLLGYCLRPGFGDPVDEWRLREIWKLYPQGVQFHRQDQCRLEWWIFWRRVAGGLKAGQQWHIAQQLAPSLAAGASALKSKSARKAGKRLGAHEELEVWMALANFERLPTDTKVQLGRMLLEKLAKKSAQPREWWALGRLGGRIPLYGPLDRVLPGDEAAAWIDQILGWNLPVSDAQAYALAQLGRFTGDRQRDLAEADRERLRSWLEAGGRHRRYVKILTDPATIDSAGERDRLFGESLPLGLSLTPGNQGDAA